MKPIKFGTLAIAAAVVLGAYSTKAAIGVTVNYSKLKVSATVTTNLAEVVSGNTWKYPVKTAKFGNKQLLDLFSNWAETTWPTGAQLVIGWDWNYDVLVVDKTGTNVLYDAIGDYGDTYTHYFRVEFWDEYGVGNRKGVDAYPGYYAVVDTGTAYFELYDDYYYLDYTDLSGYGGNKQSFKQSWDSAGADTTWSDSESAKFLYSGDQYYLDWGSDATTTATISAKGKGKGSNWIGWPD